MDTDTIRMVVSELHGELRKIDAVIALLEKIVADKPLRGRPRKALGGLRAP